MRIIMLQTRRGTENHHTTRQYQKGCVYDLRETLARMFLQAGWCRVINLNEGRV